jgi:hypothetical protein
VTIGAVPDGITSPLSPLPLLFIREQSAKLFCKDAVDFFHLSQFELPTGALGRSQFVKDVIVRRQGSVLSSQGQRNAPLF